MGLSLVKIDALWAALPSRFLSHTMLARKMLEASSDVYLGEALQSILQLRAGEEAVLVNGRLVPLSNGVLQV